MKPGNRVEDKTLTIRRGGREGSPGPDYLECVIEVGEAVDERWQ
jgi:hypothetical protein